MLLLQQFHQIKKRKPFYFQNCLRYNFNHKGLKIFQLPLTISIFLHNVRL